MVWVGAMSLHEAVMSRTTHESVDYVCTITITVLTYTYVRLPGGLRRWRVARGAPNAGSSTRAGERDGKRPHHPTQSTRCTLEAGSSDSLTGRDASRTGSFMASRQRSRRRYYRIRKIVKRSTHSRVLDTPRKNRYAVTRVLHSIHKTRYDSIILKMSQDPN